MEKGWTSEQLEAIKGNARKIVVSAGAGSGKTAVLVERILRQIRSGEVSIDRLVVVTFTNLAANEMKERILRGLVGESVHLQEQMALLPRANISTIHSFCVNLLRNNFFLLDLPPNFIIGDENKLEEIKKECIDEVLNKYYEQNNTDFLELVANFGGKKGDEDLEKYILQIHEFSQSAAEPKEWLRKEPSIDNAVNAIIEDFHSQVGQAIRIANDAKILAKKFLLDGYELHIMNEIKDIGALKMLDNWNSIYAFLQNFSFSSLPRKPKEADDEDIRIVQKLRDEYKKIIIDVQKSVFNRTFEDVKSDVLKMQEQKDILCELVSEFGDVYLERKKREEMLDFNDLEHFTIELLEKYGEEIAKNYDALYVDEFQDVNEAQDRIFELLSRYIPIFIVGDVKQSIYGFRSSRPQILMSKIENGENVTHLVHNFRSTSSTIDAINNVFDKIFHLSVGGVKYDAGHRLVAGSGVKNAGISMELHLVERNKDEFSEKSKQSYEAEFVAERILELVGNDELNFGDIAVISRSGKGVISEFSEVFSKFGIPYSTSDVKNFFENEEISAIVNLLSVIDNRLQDIPLIACMRSFLFKFSDDELAEIRMRSDGAFWEAVRKSEKCKEFVGMIDKWYVFSKEISVAEVLDNIFQDLGILELTPSMQAVRQLAFDFEHMEFKGLFEFIGYVNSCIESKKEFEILRTDSQNENCVRIMTLHKSKGLEFPAVFLVNCGSQFNMRDTYSPILYDFDNGIAMDYADSGKMVRRKTVTKQMIALKKKNELISEEMRDLYVALTRASERIFVYGTVKDVNGYLEEFKGDVGDLTSFLRKNRRYIDWITYAIGDKVPVYKHFEGVESPDAGDPTDRPYDDVEGRLVYEALPTDGTPVKASVSELTDGRWQMAGECGASKSGRTQFAPTESAAHRGTVVHFVMQALDFGKVGSAMEIDEQIGDMVRMGMISENDAKLVDSGKILGFFESELGRRCLASNSVHREVKFFTELRVDAQMLHFEEWANTVRPYNVDDSMDIIDSAAGTPRTASPTNECKFSEVAGEHGSPLRMDVSSSKMGGASPSYTVHVQGVIDCYFEEDEELVIIDYKTGNRAGERPQSKMQVELYSQALEKITGMRVKECVVYGGL